MHFQVCLCVFPWSWESKEALLKMTVAVHLTSSLCGWSLSICHFPFNNEAHYPNRNEAIIVWSVTMGAWHTLKIYSISILCCLCNESRLKDTTVGGTQVRKRQGPMTIHSLNLVVACESSKQDGLIPSLPHVGLIFSIIGRVLYNIIIFPSTGFCQKRGNSHCENSYIDNQAFWLWCIL